MSKIAEYLRERLIGEVSTEPNVTDSLATDGSIFSVHPRVVVYPRTTNDVRKVARFSWRLAERGQILPLTARGNGTDTTGGAIGSGAIISFPAHMSRILETDARSQMLRVQPGLNLYAMQEAAATHGLFLPVMPDNFKVATIGGALGCNAVGTKSVKYGSMRNWVDRLEVVLSNGEVLQTGRISKRELSSKKGLQTMEGKIYRGIDNLIDDNSELIADLTSSGDYAIELVKDRDGSFDLTPLFIGSQGTLGLIVQAIVKLAPYPEEVSYLAAAITSEQDLASIAEQLLELEPSELEFIDKDTLKLIEKKDGGTPWKTVTKHLPETLIFIEFDDKQRARKVKKAAKILDSAGVVDAQIASTWEDQETLRSVHHSVSTIMSFFERGTAALPLAPEVTVAPARVPELVRAIRQLLSQNHIEGGIWGSLGTGTVSVYPLINLANLGQRQVVFKFINELQELTRPLDGAISGMQSSGRQFAPNLNKQNDPKLMDIYSQIKQIFDPYRTMNPGVIVDTTQAELLEQLRQEYKRDRFQEYNLRG